MGTRGSRYVPGWEVGTAKGDLTLGAWVLGFLSEVFCRCPWGISSGWGCCQASVVMFWAGGRVQDRP